MLGFDIQVLFSFCNARSNPLPSPSYNIYAWYRSNTIHFNSDSYNFNQDNFESVSHNCNICPKMMLLGCNILEYKAPPIKNESNWCRKSAVSHCNQDRYHKSFLIGWLEFYLSSLWCSNNRYLYILAYIFCLVPPSNILTTDYYHGLAMTCF